MSEWNREEAIAELEAAHSPTAVPSDWNREQAIAELEAQYTQEVESRRKGMVIQEQHPDFSFVDRATVKNLAQSPKKAVDYLRKQHKHLDIDLKNDQIVAKGKDEKDWRVLDPEGFDWQDLTDIGADVATAFGSGAATAAGGLAGAALGPAGAIGGASAAGAASSGALEALRQKLGAAAGIEQDVSTSDIKTSAMFGAAAPLLFGSGGTLAKAATKGGRIGQALTGETAGRKLAEMSGALGKAVAKYGREGVEAAQGSAARNVVKKAGLKGMSALSQVPEDILEAVGKSARQADDPLKAMARDVTGVPVYVKELSEKSMDTINATKNRQWKAYEAALEEAGYGDAVVDISPLMKRLKEAIAEADLDSAGLGKASKELAEELKGLQKSIFENPETGESIANQLGVRQVKTLLSTIDDKVADFTSKAAKESPILLGNKGLDKTTRTVKNLGAGMSSDLRTQLDQVIPDTKIGARAKKFKNEWIESTKLEQDLRNIVPSEQGLYNKLRNSIYGNNRYARGTMEKVDRHFGTNFVDAAKALKADEIYGGGASSVFGNVGGLKRIPAGAIGLGIGYTAGGPVGGMIGAGIGAMTFGPQAMKHMARGAARLDKVTGKMTKNLGPISRGAAGQFMRNPWMGMEE